MQDGTEYVSNESSNPPTDGARERLIEAGLYLFAVQGLEGVRTRSLADRAGVNQSAIPYYFGGKEGVYTAVIEAIANEMKEGLAVAGVLADNSQPAVSLDKNECAKRLGKLMKGFTLSLLSPGRPIERAMLIVREQLKPTQNFDILFKRFIEPLHQEICRLVAGLQDRQPDEMIVMIQAHALVGQTLAFVVAQQAFLRRARCGAIGSAEAEQIADTVAAMALAAVSVGGG
jgi:TetR/AcrR family transcriptional regulator, regulator of cefoperazone and chloramphenicol sensitivity